MGMKVLTLLPLSGGPADLGKSYIRCDTRLHLVNFPESVFQHLWKDEEWVSLTPLLPLPPQLEVIAVMNDEDAEEFTRVDHRGKQLTYIFARELKKVPWPDDLTEHWMSRAARAFVHALPDDVPVILWWS
jgi:hypothetical protein